MGTQAKSQSNGRAKLNVLFHGAFTFDEGKDKDRKQIYVSTPLMQHHVYRAGNWLAETDLRGRRPHEEREVFYELHGVSKEGTERFDPRRNLIVKVDRGFPLRTIPYVTLRLPLPSAIKSLRIADVPSTVFTHAEELETASEQQHIATLQVFTYEVEDQKTLALKATEGPGHFWEPVQMDGYFNLHVFAAEDHFHKPSNADEDFNQCTGLLGGVKLRLKTGSLRADGIFDDEPVQGVAAQETESLALRTLRIARLGRILKRKGDANLAWYGNDALDGSEGACAGPIGN